MDGRIVYQTKSCKNSIHKTCPGFGSRGYFKSKDNIVFGVCPCYCHKQESKIKTG